jgi:acid phosphatase type 7
VGQPLNVADRDPSVPSRIRISLHRGRTCLFRKSLQLAFALFSVFALLAAPRRAKAATTIFAIGPYVQEIGSTGVSVRFELATASPASVDVTPDDNRNGQADGGRNERASKLSASDTASALYHSLRVTGLKSARRYRYVARAGDAVESGTFTTAPDEATSPPFSFLVYGDNRTDDIAHAAVVRAMMTSPGDFLVNTGDFVSDGSVPEQWHSFFSIEKSLLRDRAVFGCVGNHELIDRSGAAYQRYFGPSERTSPAAKTPTRARLYWSFRWSNTRFFMLNAFDTWLQGDEREWLIDELARAKTEPGLVWRVAVLHHGPWSAGPHGPNTDLAAAAIPELLARAGIDLVLSGHDHLYERGYASGLRYVVSGGGGAPLYRINAPLESTRKVESTYHVVEIAVNAESVKLAARRIDGSLIEICSFSKSQKEERGRDWECDVSRVTPASVASVASVSGTSSARSGPPAATSRCACRVPGAGPVGSGRGVFVATASIFGVALLRRRRNRRPRFGRKLKASFGFPTLA